MTLSPHGYVARIVSTHQSEKHISHCPSAEEEIARRRGCSDLVTSGIGSHPTVSEPAVLPKTTCGTTPPADTSPSPASEEHSPGSAHPHPNNTPCCSPLPVVTETQPPQLLDDITNDEPQSAPDSTPEGEPQSTPDSPTEGEPQNSPTSVLSPEQLHVNNASPPTPAALSPRNSSPAPGHDERPTTVPMRSGAFTFDGPSTFITADTIKYLGKIAGGQHWIDMVKAYLRLEQLPAPPHVRVLFHFLASY